jgi:hypothetical protein
MIMNKVSYDRVMMQAFADELEKQALAGMLANVGNKVLRGTQKVVGAVSPTGKAKLRGQMARGADALGGGKQGVKNLRTAVGGATLAGGAGLATGAVLS